MNLTPCVWLSHHQCLVISPPASGYLITSVWLSHHQRLVVSSPASGYLTTSIWLSHHQRLVTTKVGIAIGKCEEIQKKRPLFCRLTQKCVPLQPLIYTDSI